MEIKCIFIDFDGTLFRSDDGIPKNRTISKDDEKALKKWLSLGKNVVLATGRHAGVIDLAKELIDVDVDAVTHNGAEVVIDKKVIYNNSMDRAKVEKFIQSFKYADIADYMVLFDDFIIVEDKEDSFYQKRPFMGRKKVNVSEFLAGNDPIETYKIQLRVHDAKDNHRVRDELQEALGDFFEFHISDVRSIEVGNKNVNKWKGIEVYMEKKGYKPEEIAVIGDQDNDIEMIENAPLSFGMKSGVKELEALATHMVSSVSEMIHDYLLKEHRN